MSVYLLPYIGFSDGASIHSQNLASVAWEIYAPTDQLITLHGVFLGRATNNIVEYTAVIEFLIDVVYLGIHNIIV
jgi:ribonuclease HI